jgi:hypothetical protein
MHEKEDKIQAIHEANILFRCLTLIRNTNYHYREASLEKRKTRHDEDQGRQERLKHAFLTSLKIKNNWRHHDK